MQISRNQVALAVLGVVVVGAVYFLWPSEEQSPSAAASDETSTAFAKSMDGTVPDGNIQLGSLSSNAGVATVLPYGELKRMFDYYLSALGEKSLEVIVRQIREELDKRLKPTQADAAKRLLDKYLEYKRELLTVEQAQSADGGMKAIRQRFTAMQDLRSKIFSPQENEGMFGLEDAYDMDALSRLEVSQNTTLTAEQKRDRLAALDAAMPKALREEHEAPRQVIRLEERAAEMRAKGASDADVFKMRSKELNPEAAARLAEVDREEAAWKGRINAYLAERSKLMKQYADGPAAEREAALNRLQQSKFSAEEIPRLVAYEPQ